MSASGISSIRSYSFSFIQDLASRISDLLDIETIDTLKEIKEKNKFIRRRTPLRLKYRLDTSLVDEWRKEKTGDVELSPLISYMHSITSFMNKITDKNIIKILDDIRILTETFILEHKIDLEFYDTVINRLFDSATTEENYIGLYGDVAKTLIKVLGDEFKTELINKVEKYLTENLQKESLNISSKMNYDKLCEAILEKSAFTGAYVFVSSLYHLDIIDLDTIKTYLNDLLISLQESSGDMVEKYVDCIDSFMRLSGQKMQENMEDFIEIYRDPIEELSNNKTKFKFKFRYKLELLVSFMKNDWSNDDDDEWTTIKRKP